MPRSSFSRIATGASAVDAVAAKPCRRLLDRDPVAHPHVVGLRGIVGQQQRRRVAVQRRAPVLAAGAPVDDAAELQGDELGAVADAERRHAELVDLGVEQRGALDVHAGRTAGQDQRRRVGVAGSRRAVIRLGHDLGEHLELAHPAGDELGVLRSEIDDEDGAAGIGRQGVRDQGRNRRLGRRAVAPDLRPSCSSRSSRRCPARSDAPPGGPERRSAAARPPCRPTTRRRRRRSTTRSCPRTRTSATASARCPRPECGSKARGGWRQGSCSARVAVAHGRDRRYGLVRIGLQDPRRDRPAAAPSRREQIAQDTAVAPHTVSSSSSKK